MKAVVQEKYGKPEVLQVREIPEPVAGEGEILVRVHASIATPADCAFRSADPFIVRFFGGLTRPKIRTPGTGLSGEVVAVNAQSPFKPGDQVFGCSDMEAGAYAEVMTVPKKTGALAPKPDALTHGEAAGIAYGFLTALPFLRDGANLQPGQHILVNGASGSIGYVAVQLAKHFGATVTGVCSGRNVELVKSFGADHVIDYTRDDFTKTRDTYDVVFDAVGKSSFARCKAALKPDGIYLTTVPSFAILWHMMTARKGRRGKLLTTGLRPAEAKTKDLALLCELVEAGKLKPLVGRTYPLEQVAEAHRYVETGHKVGDVVIAIAPAAAT